MNEVVLPAMDEYEARSSQAAMMKACCRNMEDGGILLAEAGTGTGKTFAYLIPVILSGKKAIVTTRTKNLQEQLVAKDLAFLSSLRRFDYAIAKGRGNYLCLRRLKSFVPSNEEEAVAHRALLAWSPETVTGDFEELIAKRSSVYDRVCSDGDACGKMKCHFFRDCFYYRARQKWEGARIVVANHALLAVNAMMPEDSKLLPGADLLIIDEGHSLDNALSGQIGINLSKQRAEKVLNRLLRIDERGVHKGLLSASHGLFEIFASVREEVGLFWNRVSYDLRNRTVIGDEFRLDGPMLDLAGSVRHLIKEIKKSAIGLFEEDEEIELGGAMTKLAVLADDIETFARGMEGFVRWPEIGEKSTALRMVPVYPREFVRSAIVPDYRSVILTSATLSVRGDFGLTRDVLGLDEAETLSLPSPFDMRKQVSIVVSRGINLRDDASGVEKLARVIREEADKKDGGVLVLFTSRDVMNRTWGFVSDELKEMGLCPMLQGEHAGRTMLEVMREGSNSVIFGLDSFWEGVDVKGDSLKCLIITKLPFEVPTEPVAAARVEMIRQSGRDPFNDYSLPKAILKFKQGFGRLIRSGTDTGRVIICDERVETKGYGRRFLESVL